MAKKKRGACSSPPARPAGERRKRTAKGATGMDVLEAKVREAMQAQTSPLAEAMGDFVSGLLGEGDPLAAERALHGRVMGLQKDMLRLAQQWESAHPTLGPARPARRTVARRGPSKAEGRNSGPAGAKDQ